LPAPGGRAACVLSYRLPSTATAETFAGRHTVVLGSGHSALTAISKLARIVQAHPGTRVSRVLRRGGWAPPLAGETATNFPSEARSAPGPARRSNPGLPM